VLRAGEHHAHGCFTAKEAAGALVRGVLSSPLFSHVLESHPTSCQTGTAKLAATHSVTAALTIQLSKVETVQH